MGLAARAGKAATASAAMNNGREEQNNGSERMDLDMFFGALARVVGCLLHSRDCVIGEYLISEGSIGVGAVDRYFFRNLWASAKNLLPAAGSPIFPQ